MDSLYLLFLLFLVLLILFFMLQLITKKPQKSQTSSPLNLKECCVIIPFRNESSQLQHLFNSISKQEVVPGMIVFVDDHSEDDSRQLVEAFIKDKRAMEILQLSDKTIGKKEAIRKAIEYFEFQYYFTIDADTYFEPDFFKHLSGLDNSDMVIRPVIMESNSLLGSFISAEYHFFNALTSALTPFYILSASGANLLFKRSTFKRADQFLKHKQIRSGDDHYLLRDFQKEKAKISLVSDRASALFTKAPNSLKAYFDQRIRWLGKTKRRTNFIELFIGFGITLYFIGAFIVTLTVLLQGSYQLFYTLFALRLLCDVLVFAPYLMRLSKPKQILWLPFFQVVYPLLFITTLKLSLFYTPKWKGRS